MSFLIEVKRHTFTINSTLGNVYLNGELFCYSLEDTLRAEGIKIPGHTAVPDGEYEVSLSISNRFKRLMPMIYNQPNGYELISSGISFKGIRVHGGNTHEDTEGCLLVAKTKVSDSHIYGSMEKNITEWIRSQGGSGKIRYTTVV